MTGTPRKDAVAILFTLTLSGARVRRGGSAVHQPCDDCDDQTDHEDDCPSHGRVVEVSQLLAGPLHDGVDDNTVDTHRREGPRCCALNNGLRHGKGIESITP